VPAGTYVVKISALKALGDDDNPADWETVTSPTFTITR
jgi:minor extracellular serine protease Vpr